MKITLNIYSFLFNTVIFCIYILPIYELEQIGFIFDKYIFLLVVMILYAFIIIKDKKITLLEIGIIILSIILCFFRHDLSFLHIISIALIYKLLIKKNVVEKLKEVIYSSRFVYIALVGVLFYSILYFGDDGRYIHSSIKDPNMSGLAIFCLSIMLHTRKSFLGEILLMLGLLTLSKSYLIALILFIIFDFISCKHYNIKLNYALLSLIAVVSLLALSALFIELETLGKIQAYGTGINRFFTILDYSNYYRFTINTNVLNIYRNEPVRLLTGIPNDIFYKLNYMYSMSNNIRFFRIRPHNYFFAYLQIYGMWALPIFMYTYKIFKLVLSEKNTKVALPIFMYLIFLGLGAANYWLYLSIFVLLASNKD